MTDRLTVDRLRAVLEYNPETGHFKWLVAPKKNVNVGDIAGHVGKDGYRRITIDGWSYRAGRLAWFYVHEHWPIGLIDHKNIIPGDDRFINLREVNHSLNAQNIRRAHCDSRSGLLGAYPTCYGTFRSLIRIDGKNRHLGTFATPEAAHRAYLQAKRTFHLGCTI